MLPTFLSLIFENRNCSSGPRLPHPLSPSSNSPSPPEMVPKCCWWRWAPSKCRGLVPSHHLLATLRERQGRTGHPRLRCPYSTFDPFCHSVFIPMLCQRGKKDQLRVFPEFTQGNPAIHGGGGTKPSPFPLPWRTKDSTPKRLLWAMWRSVWVHVLTMPSKVSNGSCISALSYSFSFSQHKPLPDLIGSLFLHWSDCQRN